MNSTSSSMVPAPDFSLNQSRVQTPSMEAARDTADLGKSSGVNEPNSDGLFAEMPSDEQNDNMSAVGDRDHDLEDDSDGPESNSDV